MSLTATELMVPVPARHLHGQGVKSYMMWQQAAQHLSKAVWRNHASGSCLKSAPPVLPTVPLNCLPPSGKPMGLTSAPPPGLLQFLAKVSQSPCSHLHWAGTSSALWSRHDICSRDMVRNFQCIIPTCAIYYRLSSEKKN